MSRSRQQPKGKFKSENFKGTLGCASSKGDVQGKRELNPDTGALAERKGFHAFSVWKEKSTTPQKPVLIVEPALPRRFPIRWMCRV